MLILFLVGKNPTNKIILVEPDIYTLYWSHSDTDIVYELKQTVGLRLVCQDMVICFTVM